MKTSISPSSLLAELTRQHDALRAIMARCEQLADEVDRAPRAGHEAVMQTLIREVAKLRLAFTSHNQFEEKLLRPVLAEHDSFGEVRIAQMVADHIGEHRAMAAQLDGPTAAMRGVIAELWAHLEAEEKYFLTSRVLRDDLVTIEGGG